MMTVVEDKLTMVSS